MVVMRMGVFMKRQSYVVGYEVPRGLALCANTRDPQTFASYAEAGRKAQRLREELGMQWKVYRMTFEEAGRK
jgi:hypothetical protein